MPEPIVWATSKSDVERIDLSLFRESGVSIAVSSPELLSSMLPDLRTFLETAEKEGVLVDVRLMIPE